MFDGPMEVGFSFARSPVDRFPSRCGGLVNTAAGCVDLVFILSHHPYTRFQPFLGAEARRRMSRPGLPEYYRLGS